jgi:hypothetical protein
MKVMSVRLRLLSLQLLTFLGWTYTILALSNKLGPTFPRRLSISHSHSRLSSGIIVESDAQIQIVSSSNVSSSNNQLLRSSESSEMISLLNKALSGEFLHCQKLDECFTAELEVMNGRDMAESMFLSGDNYIFK